MGKVYKTDRPHRRGWILFHPIKWHKTRAVRKAVGDKLKVLQGGKEMSLTDDRNDPDLHVVEDSGMQKKYLVLSEEERKKGFVRPVRQTYVHEKCGVATTMGLTLSETYARDPKFYGATYCVGCKAHFPVGEKGEFHWDDGQKVGS